MLRHTPWQDFSAAVCARFERDQHNHLLRQFFHIKQLDTDTEYVEHFDSLMHQILAHDPLFSPSAIVNRFIDGLASNIRAVVFIHRPLDLDTAVSLALLQEEMLTPTGIPISSISGDQFTSKNMQRSMPVSAALLPRINQEGQRKTIIPEHNRTMAGEKRPAEERKASALMAYRKAKGLCYKCGSRWGPTHKCGDTVPLHMVEELWQLFEQSGVSDDPVSAQEDSGDDLMVLSFQAIHGTEAPQTIKLMATLFSKKVIMLVDSGSSSSFISQPLAALGPSLELLPHPVQVKVANGQAIWCTHYLPHCKVCLPNHSFFIDLKVLPLQCYDIILGMDWLSTHCPMEIHWQDKWLAFQQDQQRVILQGQLSDNYSIEPVSASQLHHLDTLDELWCTLTLRQSTEPTQADPLPKKIEQLITRFASLFDPPNGLPPNRSHYHTIPLVQGATPFRIRPYRYNPAQKDEIERQVADLLSKGMIQPSCSPYASPIILARKKTGDWRLCIDYRHLNSLTIKNKYPLPVMDELLDELQGAVWFTSLDLSSGYHQIPMDPKDIPKTAFQTHNGHFEYKVMPYGVTGGPTTFQLTMNSVLAPLLSKCVVVFIDDILIFSKNWDDHLLHIRTVFSILDQNQFKVNLSKCSFAQQKLHYLGHVISHEGVATDPTKVIAIKSWPTPRNAKDIRSFLGLAGYYRKFIKNFGIISRPLTNLLKKGQLFVWHADHETSFKVLKEALVTTPVLALPDFTKQFEIETDVCDKGVGAVLHQAGHPIAFVSKALGPRHLGLSTYEKECLAILMAVDHWRQYLIGSEFIIRTDQRSLVHLDDQRLTTPWQQKALTKLLGLRYQICYKQGLTNTVADALSRVQFGQLLAVTVLQPAWLQLVTASYDKHSDTAPILQMLAVQSSSGNYTIKDGLLFYKDRILIPSKSEFPRKIFLNFHASPIGGHSGFVVT